MFVYNSRRSHCIFRALGISFASPRNNSFLCLSWCLSHQIVGLYFSFYVYVFWRCFLYSYYTVSTLKLFKSCSSFGAKTYWKRRIERYFNLFDTFLPIIVLYILNFVTKKTKAQSIKYGCCYNPQIQISVVSGTKRSIFRQKNKTKRSKKGCTQHL